MLAMQYCLNQEERIATTLSSMIDDYQLKQNLKAATTATENKEQMDQVSSIFNDLPVVHWETLEVNNYWKEMQKNDWKQPSDVVV